MAEHGNMLFGGFGPPPWFQIILVCSERERVGEMVFFAMLANIFHGWSKQERISVYPLVDQPYYVVSGLT